MSVECSAKFDLELIPMEGTGMFNKVEKGAW